MPDGQPFSFCFLFVILPHFHCGSGSSALHPRFKRTSDLHVLAPVTLTVNSDNTTDLRWKNGTVYHFVPISFQLGSLLGSITDRNGNTIAIARDGSGNATSITDPVGRSLVLAYDSGTASQTLPTPRAGQ